MRLIEKIKSIYPELKDSDFIPGVGKIIIADNSDGLGEYILSWERNELEKPTDEQLKGI
jgi:hypothetical protein